MQLGNNISVKIQQAHALSYKGEFEGHSNSITGIQIDPNNPNTMFSSSSDCSLKFWDLRQFKRPSKSEDKQQLTITTTSLGHEMRPIVTIKNSKH